MDAMESIKTEAREAINDVLGPFRAAAADRLAGYDDTVLDDGGTWDQAVEAIVARIESAAEDMDPQPFALGQQVEHRDLTAAYGLGEVVARVEDDGVLHTIKVLWLDLNSTGHFSPRELREVQR